ncbi:MAG TPA: alpha/beta hydrolase family protein [Candidatus Ratteibacteria bacterium]|nr:alpha/beta hydrolase family protein [bacterium]HON04781.1 alpha/beta hydrolase family protein [bacterium]HPC29088.1 alpha/beta hydrolase family protein [bacterium]HRS05711.1 alpha/beta hydrolase family protein [Candidatus Ratteibacteria bacterium]HRV03459.1 alpha/beta hydrolase family protein [Candidatus Ratteibacteria bacterium]
MKNDYRHMMLDYFIKRMRKMNEERETVLKEIKSQKDALKYQEKVRSTIKKAFSPLPEKTPLNPKITGTVKRKNYRIEKIIFESRPECLVTSNLYIPEKFDPPFPAVIGTCGHSINGKAAPKYQEFCQRLVHNGFLVLIYDPFNQGERDQYTRLPKNSLLKRGCCAAHNMMGKQMQIIDEFFGTWRLWDGIRALDYILQRPEADKKFIGVTGNSGGGTMTTWLWPNEKRFTVAAPSCFISPFRYNIENEMPQDIEQCPPEIFNNYIEISDFFIARAPDPVILLGQNYDYFDIRGFKEIYEQVKRFYEIFGAQQNLAYFIGNNPHGYYSDAQKAMVSFFCKIAEKQIVCEDPEIKIENEDTLFATKNGSVISSGSKPVYKIIGEIADKINQSRKKMSEEELKKQIKKLLKIPETKVPYYRVLRPQIIKKEIIARYAIETEPGIWVILKNKSERPDFIYNLEVEKEINLCIPNISSEDEILKKRKFLPGCQEYFIDVRGIGESMPEEKKNFFRPYGYDFMIDRCFYMFGESYLGKRIYDTLSVIELLKSKGCEKINLYGNYQGAIIGIFVAFLSDVISKVYLEKLLDSFSALSRKISTGVPSSNLPKGILKITDIPEIIDAVKKKKELIIL